MRKGARGLCALVALLLCLGCWTVYAAEVDLVLGSAVIKDGVLTLTGELTEEAAVDCTVTVFKTTGADMSLFDYAGKTGAQLAEDQQKLIDEDRLLDMAEVKTTKAGKFTYTLDLKKNAAKVGEGDYVRVAVRAAGTSKPVVANAYYASAADTSDALVAIGTTSTEDMLSYLSGEIVSGELPVANILGLDLEGYYDLLSDDGRKSVAEGFIGSYSTVESANAAFDAAVKTAAQAEIKFGSVYNKSDKIDIYDLTLATQLTGENFKEYPEADMDLNKTITQSDINAIVELVKKAL